MEPHLTDMFRELHERLETLRGSAFVFVPNPGNAGDNIINCSACQLFDRMGLTYEFGNCGGTYAGRSVVFSGGGNLVEPYVAANEFMQHNAPVCERMILLPHTIRAYGDTISALDDRCEIFCRDKPTFEFVSRHARGAKVFLGHDLAFQLDVAAVREVAKRFPAPLLTDYSYYRLLYKRLVRAGRYRLRSRQVLDAFRTDREKTGIAIPARNIDVSEVFATRHQSKALCLESTCRMLRFVDGYETVNTNRLHVAILAGKLGKRVNFHDNSYGKNRAVFEHSMGGMENVVWCSNG